MEFIFNTQFMTSNPGVLEAVVLPKISEVAVPGNFNAP